jgi:signal-transduction protein with cAMP-binding, CBS, and nucleotidyltransferase domain
MSFSRLGALSRKFSSSVDAYTVFKSSCYHKIDFKIQETAPVKDAVLRFKSFNIGCLAVTNDYNRVIGVCTERDFINKVALTSKNIDELKVNDICTFEPDLIIVKKGDSLETCMNKMLFKDIRHLLVMDEKSSDFVGLISIKDLIKEVMSNKNDTISRLSDFKIGKGSYFGSE